MVDTRLYCKCYWCNKKIPLGSDVYYHENLDYPGIFCSIECAANMYSPFGRGTVDEEYCMLKQTEVYYDKT